MKNSNYLWKNGTILTAQWKPIVFDGCKNVNYVGCALCSGQNSGFIINLLQKE